MSAATTLPAWTLALLLVGSAALGASVALALSWMKEARLATKLMDLLDVLTKEREDLNARMREFQEEHRG